MQADVLACYLVVQAGYDLHKVGTFLRRVARAEASMAHRSFGNSHPSTASRIAAFERVVEEIDQKIQQGTLRRVDLRPEQDAAMANTSLP